MTKKTGGDASNVGGNDPNESEAVFANSVAEGTQRLAIENLATSDIRSVPERQDSTYPNRTGEI